MIPVPKTNGTDGAFYRAVAYKIAALENESTLLRAEIVKLRSRLVPVVDAETTRPDLGEVQTLTASITMEDSSWANRELRLSSSSAYTVTLPTPTEDDWVKITYVGTSTLTINNESAVAICSLAQGQTAHICSMSISGTQAWCKRPLKHGNNGYAFQDQPIVIEKQGSGVIFKGDEATPHWWRLTVAGGTLTLTDTGTTAFNGVSTVVTT